MAQSNNEFNVRGIPPFWQNHTVDLPIPAKENIDIKNLLNPSERHHHQPPNLENPLVGETENQRK